MGLFDKFKIGLGKSSDGLSTGFKNIFSKKKIDENILSEFEELIITADAGVEVAKELRRDFENFKVDKKYVRPNLLNTIPVDENGNLLSPNDCGLSQNFNIGTTRNSFKFGDGAPVETAWRRSSEYPFSLLRALTANKPCKTFATAFDRIRQKRNSANQIIYSSKKVQSDKEVLNLIDNFLIEKNEEPVDLINLKKEEIMQKANLLLYLKRR